MFEIGDMVVAVYMDKAAKKRVSEYCGRHFGTDWPPGCAHIEKGRIYTIRGFEAHRPNALGLYLEEIINPLGPAGYEWSYQSEAFRKVRKTNIEELRKLVTPLKTGEVVR